MNVSKVKLFLEIVIQLEKGNDTLANQLINIVTHNVDKEIRTGKYSPNVILSEQEKSMALKEGLFGL